MNLILTYSVTTVSSCDDNLTQTTQTDSDSNII